MPTLTEDQVRRDLWKASWMSSGEAPSEAGYSYWLSIYQGLYDRGEEIHYGGGGRQYALDKMLGWQATGADVPKYGRWAQPPSPFHEVPPYPADGQPASVPPATPAPPESAFAELLGLMLDRFDHLEQAVALAADRPAPIYTATLKLPSWLGGPQTITLTPQKRGADGMPR